MSKYFTPGDWAKDKIFFTSDLHFNHANAIKFDNRPFKDVHEMNEGLIANHNKVVPEDGLTYFCGDMSMGKDVNSIVSFLTRMNGKKVLIIGNHDKHMLKEQAFRDCFVAIYDYYSPNLHGTKFVLFHYPIYSYDQAHRGAIHLYGHIHLGQAKIQGKAVNVGTMNHNYTPVSLVKIFELVKDIPVSSHHDN